MGLLAQNMSPLDPDSSPRSRKSGEEKKKKKKPLEAKKQHHSSGYLSPTPFHSTSSPSRPLQCSISQIPKGQVTSKIYLGDKTAVSEFLEAFYVSSILP